MLIRSQDGMKIKHLNSCIEIYLIGSSVNIDGSTFGEYSTQEKAIKVLDMICAEYQVSIYRNVIDENEVAIYENTLFKMPQDSEVNWLTE